MLWDLGAGDQISRMVVGALRDCGQLTGTASDVKGDVYVCRVLGRAVLGEATDPETAVRLARQLHSADPWQLDAQLWDVGKSYCHAIIQVVPSAIWLLTVPMRFGNGEALP